jgi:hypothetical protein
MCVVADLNLLLKETHWLPRNPRSSESTGEWRRGWRRIVHQAQILHSRSCLAFQRWISQSSPISYFNQSGPESSISYAQPSKSLTAWPRNRWCTHLCYRGIEITIVREERVIYRMGTVLLKGTRPSNCMAIRNNWFICYYLSLAEHHDGALPTRRRNSHDVTWKVPHCLT